MANVFYKYSTVATHGEAMWNLKEALKAAGWVHQRSSQGTGGTFTLVAGNANDVLTSSYKFNATFAWWVGRMPGANREIFLQRSDTGPANYRASYAPDYTPFRYFGSASAGTLTTPPTTWNSCQFCGYTVSASWLPLFGGTEGTQRQKIMVQDAAPYGWWMWVHPPGALGYTGLYMDPLKTGSYPEEDTDPYVLGSSYATVGQLAFKRNTMSQESAGAYQGGGYANLGLTTGYGQGFAGTRFTNVQAHYYRNHSREVGAGAVGVNPHNSKADLLPVFWGRNGSVIFPAGHKGGSTFFKMPGSALIPCDTVSVGSSMDHIVLGDVVAPWDGTTPEA